MSPDLSSRPQWHGLRAVSADRPVARRSIAATPLPIELLAEIRDALEESRVLPRVDVVDLMRASAELRRRVHEEGIRWTG